ncbi:MAG TPA: molybdenum cofactor biosynthesis protein MoaD [Solibacterales bacterium]|nr:molybdenum cofactor biosynthesis protein MoaD [Bryobacterales bacterium]
MLKDLAGRAEDTLELREGASVESVFEHYATVLPRLAPMRKSIVLARNQEFSDPSSRLEEGDEIAFLPPVSGGTGREIEDSEGHYFALTRETIDSRALSARLLRGTDGAVVVFEGVVRNNSQGRATRYLDYECYEPMALKVMASIGREIAGSHSIGRIALVHRLGRMEVGEASVAVVVTAPHRRPAFEAALEGINRLKKLVPVWKKEYFVDGEVWVEGEWDDKVVQG